MLFEDNLYTLTFVSQPRLGVRGGSVRPFGPAALQLSTCLA